MVVLMTLGFYSVVAFVIIGVGLLFKRGMFRRPYLFSLAIVYAPYVAWLVAQETGLAKGSVVNLFNDPFLLGALAGVVMVSGKSFPKRPVVLLGAMFVAAMVISHFIPTYPK